MSAHPPPVPPANRSPKGSGEAASIHKSEDHTLHPSKVNDNLGERGEQGNMHQNTTNTGYQQDR